MSVGSIRATARNIASGFALALACIAPAEATAAVVGETTLFSTLCTEKAANGFIWKSGHWVASTLKGDRYEVARVEPNRPGCQDVAAGKKGFSNDQLSIAYGCYSIHPADVADRGIEGQACREIWLIKDGVHTLYSVICGLEAQAIAFQPDGVFHLSSITLDLEAKPKNGEKGALYVSYGTCKTE